MNIKTTTKSMIGLGGFWTINKKIYRKLGFGPTLLLQHLVDLEDSFFDGEFYQQYTRLEKDLGLTKKQLQDATKKLVEVGFISVIRKGIPSKNFYTINHANITGFLSVEFNDTVADPQGSSSSDKKDPQSGSAGSRKTKNLDTKNKVTNNLETKNREFETLKDLKAENKEALFFIDEEELKDLTIDQQKAIQLANELNLTKIF
jgi:hypothetical protein